MKVNDNYEMTIVEPEHEYATPYYEKTKGNGISQTGTHIGIRRLGILKWVTAAVLLISLANLTSTLLIGVPVKNAVENILKTTKVSEVKQLTKPASSETTTSASSTLSDSDDSERCAVSWTAFNESCYLFGATSVTFSDALDYCIGQGAYLVQIHSAAENEFLRQRVIETKMDHWIGLTDLLTAGVWRWYGTNARASFTDWAPGEPNNISGNEHCVHFMRRLSFHWNDEECYQRCKPICER